jgi:hypothetical protein
VWVTQQILQKLEQMLNARLDVLAAYLRDEHSGREAKVEEQAKAVEQCSSTASEGEEARTRNQRTFQRIPKLIYFQEKEIQNHPSEIASIYHKGRDAFIKDATKNMESGWSRSMSLSGEESSLIDRLMISSTFISAWSYLSGDKTSRDRERGKSACLLIAELGFERKQVTQLYIHYEWGWRQWLRSEGLAPIQHPILVLVIALIVLVLMSLIVLRSMRLP